MTTLNKPEGLRIALIAATDNKNAIGRDGQLPWKHKGDMAFFKRTTTGHMVAMGRKTFESMDHKPLRKRHNIVLSKTLDGQFLNNPPLYPTKDMTSSQVVDSAQEILEYASRLQSLMMMSVGHDPTLYVIGGSSLYELFFPIADILYLSLIDTEIEDADTWFPKFDMTEWRPNYMINHPADGDDAAWSVMAMTRKYYPQP